MASEYIYTLPILDTGAKSFTMPKGFEEEVEIHCWGAGGGLGRGGQATPGGGGGYAMTTATISEGDVVTLSVGQPGTNGRYPLGGSGGLSFIGRRYGGGNSAEAWDEDADSGAGGGGGGASVVLVNDSVVCAGAGGGGASGYGEDNSGRQAGKPGGSWNSLSSRTTGGDAKRASASGGGGGGGYPKGGAAGYGVGDDNYAGPQAGSGGQNYGDTTQAGSGALPGGRTSQYYPGASRGKSQYPGYIVLVFRRKFNVSVKNPDGSGDWVNLDAAYTKVAGTWKLIQQAFTKVDGEWKSILSQNPISLAPYRPDRVSVSVTISADQDDYRLINAVQADANYLEGYTDVAVTVNAGVVIKGNKTTTAFGIGGFYTGDRITLTNNGTIAGRGGIGGRGAYTYQQNKSTATANAGAGGNGGNGLIVEGVPLNLINNNIIQAGGGGGGGGGLARSSNKNGSSYTNGGQGGGGAAYGTGANNGTLSAGGAGQTVSGAGNGGAGGAPGSAGSAGVSSSSAGAAGGKSGWAILGADQVTFTTVGTITGPSGVVRSGTIDVYRVVS